MTLEASCHVRNPFEGRDAQADEEQAPVSHPDELVNAVLSALRGLDREHFKSWLNGKHDEVTSCLMAVLSPLPPLSHSQIQAAYDHMSWPLWSGFYLSGLIQRAYDAGSNDFTLTPHEGLDCLGYQLHGTAANPLRMRVQGGVQDYLLIYATHCKAELIGDVRDLCGSYAKDCTVVVHGNAGGAYGDIAQRSTFAARQADYFGGHAKQCTFDIGCGKIDFGNFAENCGFRIHKLDQPPSEKKILVAGSHNTYHVPRSSMGRVRKELGLNTFNGWLLNLAILRNRVEELRP